MRRRGGAGAARGGHDGDGERRGGRAGGGRRARAPELLPRDVALGSLRRRVSVLTSRPKTDSLWERVNRFCPAHVLGH